MKRSAIFSFITFLMVANISVGQNAVSIDSISGFMAPNKIPVGQPVRFSFRYTGSAPSGELLFGFTTAFDLYSPGGATWTVPTFTVANNPAAMGLRNEWGPINFFINSYNANGSGHDTLSLFASDYTDPWEGITSFDDQLMDLTVPAFPQADTGKAICIDSCSWFSSGMFHWSFATVKEGEGQLFERPATYGTGPYAANYTAGMGYCFTLATPPYICGDINNNGTVTVADMVYLIQYFFNSGPAIPAPTARANVNCLGDPNRPTIADNTYLVSYLFNNGPVPCANCP